MNLGKTLANILINNRENTRQATLPSIQNVDNRFDAVTQFELGTFDSPKKPKRTRKQIYSQWQLMQSDPQISEALSLHVTAALGGHETTGDVIFISPHERVRGKGLRAKRLREQVEREAKKLTPILNRNAFGLARQAVGYGDSYARIYTHKERGIIDLVNNEYTHPPLIQAFERGGDTIGFFVLEMDNWTNAIAKLSPAQMLRVKMPRVEIVPQFPLGVWLSGARQIEFDIKADMPILPAPVGGSFLHPVESAWEDAMLNLVGLNNQQIADSVKQAFLTVNMEGMPPNQQKKYKEGLVKTLQNYRDRIKSAFQGGEELYGTNYHILPTWGDKQNIQAIGDLSQRQTPMSTETLMLNLRRIAGGLGMDLALVGWSDMLAGGLGDGAAFHTSAQIMRRSMLIRQSMIDSYNSLFAIHWGIKYGEYFNDGEYPWQFDFYSDQSAAASEMLINKQTRMNTMALQSQTLLSLRELGLDKETLQIMLEDEGGIDMAKAAKIAIAMTSQPATPEDNSENGAHTMPNSLPEDNEEVNDEGVDDEDA